MAPEDPVPAQSSRLCTGSNRARIPGLYTCGKEEACCRNSSGKQSCTWLSGLWVSGTESGGDGAGNLHGPSQVARENLRACFSVEIKPQKEAVINNDPDRYRADERSVTCNFTVRRRLEQCESCRKNSSQVRDGSTMRRLIFPTAGRWQMQRRGPLARLLSLQQQRAVDTEDLRASQACRL